MRQVFIRKLSQIYSSRQRREIEGGLEVGLVVTFVGASETGIDALADRETMRISDDRDRELVNFEW